MLELEEIGFENEASHHKIALDQYESAVGLNFGTDMRETAIGSETSVTGNDVAIGKRVSTATDDGMSVG